MFMQNDFNPLRADMFLFFNFLGNKYVFEFCLIPGQWNIV